jgi:hypothetical protein
MPARSNKLSGAFVLRLRLETECNERIEGVVEHVESGRALQFQSLSDLLEFLTEEMSKARQGAESVPMLQ